MVTAFVAGAALAGFGYATLNEPLTRAFWDVACVVMLMVLAWDGISSHPRLQPLESNSLSNGVDWRSYSIACVPVLLAALMAAGVGSALVAASIAFSLLGMLLLFTHFRLPAAFAIGLLLLQSALFLTWPIWSSSLLVRFESQPLVDLLVMIGPLFAINGSIDPTDPFTHRPLAYRLMNLGQDVPYEMPHSIWPCVLVHFAAGVPGVLMQAFAQRNNVKTQTPEPADGKPG